MKAKLVRFEITSRVIINDNDSDEMAVQTAMDKIAKNPRDYLTFDNVVEVEDDTEVPFDPESAQDMKEIAEYN